MAIYRNVSLSFWTDTKVTDDFSPEDRYFMLYCLTNPHTNIVGCYEISLRQMANETGYNIETVGKILDRFNNTHRIIQYDKETKELYVTNWHKYNWTKSEKILKPILSAYKAIKSEKFKASIGKIINEIYGEDTVSIWYQYPIDTTDTVTDTDTDTVTDNVTDNDTDTNNNNRAKTPRFIPPTVDEVKDYCWERMNNVDAQRFVDFYESKGWMVGKNKMKDWKAAVRNWERDQQSTVVHQAKPNQNKQGRLDWIDDI